MKWEQTATEHIHWRHSCYSLILFFWEAGDVVHEFCQKHGSRWPHRRGWLGEWGFTYLQRRRGCCAGGGIKKLGLLGVKIDWLEELYLNGGVPDIERFFPHVWWIGFMVPRSIKHWINIQKINRYDSIHWQVVCACFHPWPAVYSWPTPCNPLPSKEAFGHPWKWKNPLRMPPPNTTRLKISSCKAQTMKIMQDGMLWG